MIYFGEISPQVKSFKFKNYSFTSLVVDKIFAKVNKLAIRHPARFQAL